MIKKITAYVSLSALVLVSGILFATDDTNKKACESSLSHAERGTSSFEVIPSDRVPSDVEKYRAYVKELVEPGGVIEQLGIKMTGQIVEFLQGRDLNALTSGTAGGYPISHYLDGASVLDSLKPQSSFALEVVYPGPIYQHGFYRDDNPYAKQISIIDHVVGHNNFAMVSGLSHYRVAQGLQASKQLDELIRTLYSSFDKDEVQRFYLWALTLNRLIDWYTPFYQDSKEFEPKVNEAIYDPLGRAQNRVTRHPKNSTENVLAAFAANISPTEPPWKRQMLELMAQIMAFRPALVHTQIMNEGWASIMQEIIPRHTKENHKFPYWFEASQVMQTEMRPNLKDPYSLGVFAWRNLRQKFEARPEITTLPTQMAKDREFIAYAEGIIGSMDDSQFLRLALDQAFIDKYKLAVVRKTMRNETDPNLPPPNPPPKTPVMQWVVVTREAEKVVNHIIDTVVKPKYWFNPRVRLVNFNRPGTGEVELVLDDEVSNSLALDQESLSPSLYAMAQWIGKPVSLVAHIAGGAAHEEAEPDDNNYPFFMPPPPPRQQKAPPLLKIRITVAPNGDVQVFRVADVKNQPSSEQADPGLSRRFTEILKAYLDDLYLEDPKHLNRIVQKSQSLREIAGIALAQQIDDVPYGSLLEHAPNAAGAIMEYKAMVDRRLLSALELATKNKGKIAIVGQKARVKALPSVVNIQFDREYMQLAHQASDVAPIDAFKLNRVLDTTAQVDTLQGAFGPFSGADGSVYGPIDANPGDRFWGPNTPPGGESSGAKPGEDETDLSWVDLPDDLYARFLGERVKLPVLNRKPGQAKVKKFKPGRRINRIFGQQLPNEIINNAFTRGFGHELAEGKDPQEDLEATFDSGFANLLPRDWVVKSQQVVKKPDTKAVVTFVLDASGSTAQFIEAFKRFVFDIKTLIAANYKGFAYRFVIFDHGARVVKDEASFFRAELGGGTSYAAGINKAKELFEAEYPRAQWDRYTFIMGDMEDYATSARASVSELLEVTEFLGVVAGLHQGHDPGQAWSLVPLFQPLAQSEPNVGWTVISPDGKYTIDNIREVLKNDEDAE